jgi:hypothetical protein
MIWTAYLAYAAAWVSTAAAVAFTAWVSQSAWPICFMVLPALIDVKASKGGDSAVG